MSTEPTNNVGPSVHHIVRALTRNPLQSDGVNVLTGWELDKYLSSYRDNGYKIVYVQHFETTPEGWLQMLYVLEKE